MYLVEDDRGAIYIFSVVLIAAMLVILVGSLVALEKTTSGSIASREEELSYFQLECVRAVENKISSVMALDPSGDSLRPELDETVSVLREQAEERGMWQNISYEIDFQPSSMDLSPRRVFFEVTTKSGGKMVYDSRESYLNDIFVSSGYLFLKNGEMELRFRVLPGSDEERGTIEGGAVYVGSDVILGSSVLTDYLNISTWTNTSSTYDYTIDQEPGLVTVRMRNETEKAALTKFLYVKPDEFQFQVNVEPLVSTENRISYGIGLTPNVNGPGDDVFRMDNTTGGQLNPSREWSNATAENLSLQIEKVNSWIVVHDPDPQPYSLALILDDAAVADFSSTAGDQCVLTTAPRRGRFIVNGYIRSYRTLVDAVTDMRNLKKLGKPPSGRSNYLEPLVLALTIDDLYFDPPGPEANQRVAMTAAVNNYGTKDAYDVVVHFYDGEPLADRSNLLGVTNLSTILNGEIELCSTTWTFTEPGVHEIYAVLDPDNLLLEDHTDNVKHAPLKIFPQDEPNHDVAVEALHLSETSPSDGDTVSVSALIHNDGNRDEEDVVVRLQVIDSSNVSRNISFNIVPDIPIDYYVTTSIGFIYQDGDERVRMSADPVVNETDLADNHREAYIGSSGVLVVADDNVGPRDGNRGSTSGDEVLSALDDPTKYHVVFWSEEERGGPTVDVLLFFDAVVWTCGDYDGHDVETDDARTLVEFVDRGGHLVLEGEDIAYRHHQNATGQPDFFLWNATRTYIDGYYDPDLVRTVPLDDVELDGSVENTVPQINVYPTHPVMTNMPIAIPSNYTAPYPDGIVPVGATELTVYESPDPAFLVLEDSMRSGDFNWKSSSSLISSPVLSGDRAYASNGNNYFYYTFPYEIGDGVDQYRFIDLWFYFKDSNADILLQVRDQSGSWNHRWGWDVESSYNGYSWARKGTTLNCPWGKWIHYRLDLVTDLGLSPGTNIRGLAFSANNWDVYYDHIRFARKDSWKTSSVAYENATSGTKVAYFAYPFPVVENRTRRLLIKNAVDWVGGMELNRAPIITITSPSGAEVWTGSQDVTWSASDPDGDEICVDLYYSTNGGITWLDLARGLTGVSQWTWDTTTVADGSYLIKAVADDSTLTSDDISASFEVDNINDPPTVTVTRPGLPMRFSGTEKITWTATDPEGEPLTYDVEWWNGTVWQSLASGYSPPNPSSPEYLWDTTTVPDGIDYLIRVRAMDGVNSVEDDSALFSVDNANEDPSVILIDPNGGEEWSGTHTIVWDMDDPDGAEGGDPLGHEYRDTLTATIDLESSDAVFKGSYSPDSQGFIRDWLLVGGYSGYDIHHDYLGGESSVLPWSGKVDQGERWWSHRDSDTRIDFNSLMSPNQYATGYGFSYVYSEEERDVKMKVGSDDEMKVYLNGVEEFCYPNPRGASPDQNTIDVHLNEGWNTVLVKVCEHSGGWAFYFRFVNMTGFPITDLSIALAKPNLYDTGLTYATGARLGAVVDMENLNWDTTTFPNGNYTAKVTVEDGRGGLVWDDSDSEFEVVNNRDPVVDITYPNGDEILFGNVTVVWNATDPDGDDMVFDLYYKQGTDSWSHIIAITNTSWRWYLWDISGLPDSPPEYYIKVEARDGRGGLGWDVSDDGWYINNAEGEYGDGGSGNYTGYGDGDGNIGGSGTPPGWGGGGGGDPGDDDPADRESLVMLTYPLGGEELSGSETISWVHDNFGAGLQFDVLASADSGSTWFTVAGGLTSNSYSWDTTAYGDSNDYRIMVEGYDTEGNVDTDSSNDFRVYNNELPSVHVDYPNGGEWVSDTVTITWSANDPDGDGDNDPSTPYDLAYDVYYSDNSGGTWTQIGSDITSATSFDWDTTGLADGSDYRVKVVAKDGNIKGRTVYDISNSDFNVDNSNDAPVVSLSYPNGGEELRGNIQIQWSASDPDADTLTHSIYYSDDAGASWNPIVEGFTDPGPDHTYDWDSTGVPDGTDYMIKVEADDGSLQSEDASSSRFTVDNTAPTVGIDDPDYPPAPVVHGTIEIDGDVSDLGGSGVDSVEIWIRGIFEGYAAVAGDEWDFSIDTTTLPEDATVTVEARAYDGSGNTASDSIEMKIDNVGN